MPALQYCMCWNSSAEFRVCIINEVCPRWCGMQQRWRYHRLPLNLYNTGVYPCPFILLYYLTRKYYDRWYYRREKYNFCKFSSFSWVLLIRKILDEVKFVIYENFEKPLIYLALRCGPFGGPRQREDQCCCVRRNV